MNLSSAEARELLYSQKYISFRFKLFDEVNQSYYGVKLTPNEAQSFSHQSPTINEYIKPVQSGGSFGYSYSYNTINKHSYVVTHPNGDKLHIYQKEGSPESKEFSHFLVLISLYPNYYQYYLGDLEDNSKYIDVIIFLDFKLFIKHYEEHGSLSKNMVALLQKYALNSYKIYKLKDCSQELEHVISPDFKLNLFDYQKQTITWMIRTENTDYKFQVPKSSFFKLAEKAYIELLQKNNDEFLSQFIYENDYQSTEMIKCRGGILADIMGNGKTVTSIALIYHNQALLLPILTSVIEREVYIPSRATLVICPTNIASQWESEIDKCLGPNGGGLKILKITTKTQMNKYNLQQLVDADIIITTYTWLSHISHIGTNFVKKNRSVEVLAEQKKQKLKYGDQYHLYNNITLLFIKYYRIFYDEFHEEIDSVQKQNSMLYIIKNCLRSKIVWGCSGTPLLDNEKIMTNIPDLLRIHDTANNVYKMDIISQHSIYDRYVRRNEKQYLPPINYRIVKIKQTIQEKLLYDSSASQDLSILLQLCCYHNINNIDMQNIDDVSKVQNELRHKQKTQLIDSINDIKISLTQIDTFLRTMNPSIITIKDLYYLVDPKHPKHTHKLVQLIQQTPTLQLQVESLRQYKKYEQNITIKTDELAKLDQCIEYYNQTLKIINESGQFICPISGETVGDGEVVITKQGHLFSKDAIETLFEFGDGLYITCPVTNTQLSRADLTIVTNKKSTSNESLNANERVFGSKISAIINGIKSLKKDEKVIIFAEWDNLLHTVGYALSANLIDHVYIKGNINIRDKAIHDFQKNPDCRVILLSSVYGASGVNLSEATHVYIVHPFHGENGQQYEKQAIGRAHRTGQTKTVTVTFFLMEKTIEEVLWDKNRKNFYEITP